MSTLIWLIPICSDGSYFNINLDTGGFAFWVPFSVRPAQGVDARYRPDLVCGLLQDLELNFSVLDPRIRKAYRLWRNKFAKEQPDLYNYLINKS